MIAARTKPKRPQEHYIDQKTADHRCGGLGVAQRLFRAQIVQGEEKRVGESVKFSRDRRHYRMINDSLLWGLNAEMQLELYRVWPPRAIEVRLRFGAAITRGI